MSIYFLKVGQRERIAILLAEETRRSLDHVLFNAQ